MLAEGEGLHEQGVRRLVYHYRLGGHLLHLLHLLLVLLGLQLRLLVLTTRHAQRQRYVVLRSEMLPFLVCYFKLVGVLYNNTLISFLLLKLGGREDE